jgi:molybdenum cofactor synthesis domain-containing protein
MTSPTIVTAAMLAIGDELLSGRTKDKNIGHLADMLTMVGIDLREVRIVADDQDAIVEALNALRSRYRHVFTSGGIGPTHDDAPGFAIENVYVMAGVPQVFQAMLDALLPSLETGTPVLSRTVRSPYGEGDIGAPLTEVQKNHPETSIGSYPKFDGKSFSTDIVIRARDAAVLGAAEAGVIAMIEAIGSSREKNQP